MNDSQIQVSITDATPIHGRRGRNVGLNGSIFNDSDGDFLDPLPSKFKTKFVDMKTRDMTKSRYDKMVAK